VEMPEAGKKISPNILCLHRLFGPSYQPTTAFEGDVICSEACRTKVGHKPDTLDHFVDHICRFGAPEGPGRAVSAVVGRNAVDASDCAS